MKTRTSDSATERLCDCKTERLKNVLCSDAIIIIIMDRMESVVFDAEVKG